jgi:hypothetical protein
MRPTSERFSRAIKGLFPQCIARRPSRTVGASRGHSGRRFNLASTEGAASCQFLDHLNRGKSRGTVKNTLLSSDLESKHQPTDHSKKPLSNAVAFAAGLGLCMFSCPVHAAPTSTCDTVRGLYDALLSTMKKGRTLGQSGRFTRLEPVFAAALTSRTDRGSGL